MLSFVVYVLTVRLALTGLKNDSFWVYMRVAQAAFGADHANYNFVVAYGSRTYSDLVSTRCH